MKNCSTESQHVISILEKLYNELTCKDTESSYGRSSINGTGLDIKSIVFKLKNYLAVDMFAEEFISYEGIKKLIEIIIVTSGNTRVY